MTTFQKIAPKKYGVTEKKKAELDALTLEVLDAQQEVDQFQAIVTALTTKLNNFQTVLAVADTNRASALNNRNLCDQLVQAFLDLQNNSAIAFNEMVIADTTTQSLATSITTVMNKLIYSAEVINKLANYVVRKKALNPLISDELVSMLTTAGNDANNAVALTLVALQSTFAAQASNMESQSATALEYIQSQDVYQLMTGTDADGKPITGRVSLKSLLYAAYKDALSYYDLMLTAVKGTTIQLNNAQTNLNKAQVQLKSLQSGLAAGNAAALAS
ncbi:MAG TPA: hypothetical protein VFJ43_16505 [Bacteroidia bacterium]|nr:hypothetical protein [Bacteroidia bacterium]